MCTGNVQKFIRESLDKYEIKSPVIDLGSGDEYIQYEPYFKNYTFILSDIKQNTRNNIHILTDITDMKELNENTFPTVTCFDTLEHVNNPIKSFEEITRILAKDGILLFSSVACWPIHNHPKDYWRFLPDALEYLCAINKLKILKLYMDPNDAGQASHIFLIAKKK
jgi:ubiquinone/menaquinone biosynthesis C-methylase UbiE